MGCCSCAVVCLGVVTLFAYIFKKIYACLYDIPKVPNLDENKWWGPGDIKTDENTSIKPFKVNVTGEELDDLKTRLSKARSFTPPLEGINHEYGFNTNLLKEIRDFWLNKYDWREREAYINQFSQYTTNIQGLNIHFLHVKPTESEGLKIVPLLLLHGWPGSVLEFYEVIPKLIKPSKGRNFVFEVVVPHLPGYVFSEGAARPGLNAVAIAIIFKKLMERLEFKQWYVQGGDWGSEVATVLSIIYPRNVLGVHVNVAFIQTPLVYLKRFVGSFWPSLVVSKKNWNRMYPLKKEFMRLMRESGYFHIQATRPDTVGVGLNDSPLGLAAYILEKYIIGTNDTYKSRPDGGLTLKFTYEKLLDIITMYWFTKSITTSMRLYAEAFGSSNSGFNIKKIPVEVPSAYAQFMNEIVYVPETILKDKYKNVLQYSEFQSGGHFAALEEPELLAEDVWNAVEKFENYHRNK